MSAIAVVVAPTASARAPFRAPRRRPRDQPQQAAAACVTTLAGLTMDMQHRILFDRAPHSADGKLRLGEARTVAVVSRCSKAMHDLVWRHARTARLCAAQHLLGPHRRLHFHRPRELESHFGDTTKQRWGNWTSVCATLAPGWSGDATQPIVVVLHLCFHAHRTLGNCPDDASHSAATQVDEWLARVRRSVQQHSLPVHKRDAVRRELDGWVEHLLWRVPQRIGKSVCVRVGVLRAARLCDGAGCPHAAAIAASATATATPMGAGRAWVLVDTRQYHLEWTPLSRANQSVDHAIQLVYHV